MIGPVAATDLNTVPDPRTANVALQGASASAEAAQDMRLRRACREFESLFLASLLKMMRESTRTLGPEEADAASGLMTELMDEQLAITLAGGGGLGLGRMLEENLARRTEAGGSEKTLRPSAPVSRLRIVERPPGDSAVAPSGATLDRVGRFAGIISQAAERHGLDPDLLRAVIVQESGGRPEAVSSKGARGLMQLMDETSRDLGVRDPHDPEESIFAGARYLRGLLDRWGGDLSKALAAYNAGPGAVEKYGGVPPYRETQRYVRSILARLGAFGTGMRGGT